MLHGVTYSLHVFVNTMFVRRERKRSLKAQEYEDAQDEAKKRRRKRVLLGPRQPNTRLSLLIEHAQLVCSVVNKHTCKQSYNAIYRAGYVIYDHSSY